ncbi:MAG: HK97 family phage prohead protease [Geminicoccaceae bacterium]
MLIDDEPRPPARRVRCKVLRPTVVEGRRFRPGEVVALTSGDAKLLRWAGNVETIGPIEPGEYVTKEATEQRQHSLVMPFTVTKSADGARKFTAVASTSAPDRHGDTIDQSGWDLTSYRRNPTVLFGHDYAALPIAKASEVGVRGGKLMVTVEFAPPGISTKGDAVWGMIEHGLLNALSVGFRPVSWEFTDTGVHYRKMELLEVSVVAVPANGEALIQSRLPTARAAEPSVTRADAPTVVRTVETQADPAMQLRYQVWRGHKAEQLLRRQNAISTARKADVAGRNLVRAELARRRGDERGEELALRMAAIALPPSEAQAARAILRRAEVDRLKSS